jgi:predicted GNAT family N-acyltransferase
VELRQVTAETTAPLRALVLRDGRAELLPPGKASDVHLGLFEGPELVATGYVRRQPLPWDHTVPAWQVRGMATVPHRRGMGLGAQVLTGLLAHVHGAGGGPVWLNARVPARSFYARAGFIVTGEPWQDPALGPHVRMWRPAG